MKLYLVTFKDANGVTENRHFVVTFGRHVAACEVDSNDLPLFTPEHELSSWGISHQSLNRSIQLLNIIEGNEHNYPVAPEVRQITDPYELRWVYIKGWGALESMLHRLAQRADIIPARRFLAVYESIRGRYLPANAEQYVIYHNRSYRISTNYGLREFVQDRKIHAEFNGRFKQCLIENSSEPLDDYILEITRDDYVIDRNMYGRVARALDHYDIQLQVNERDCGHYEHEDSMHTIGYRDNHTVCDSCFEHEVEHCEDGDYYDLRDNLYEHGDGYYYSYEEDIGSDDYDEDEDGDPNELMSYSTNVLSILDADLSINSSIHGDFRMGIELEMIGKGSYRSDVNASVQDIRSQLGEGYCICKSDGSLPEGGIEIVTAPRGLAEHIRRFKAWEVNSAYRAWDARKCGMHIHVHSKAFTALTLGKFIMFINAPSNADFIRQLAGRHPIHDSQARDYCATEYQETLTNPSTAIKGKSSCRYRMVNCENLSRSERSRLGLQCEIHKAFDTIELRIFRASLRKERLLAQIEFTHATVMFCRVASWRDLTPKAFIDWLATTNNAYPHLSDWYGLRRREGAKNSAPTQDSCVDKIETTSSSN